MTDNESHRGTAVADLARPVYREIWRRLDRLRYRSRRVYARIHTKYLADVIFIHINKTGGSSIERALGLPFQHRTAMDIREDIGAARWQGRFKFAFVRNPWDKVASHYRFRVKTDQTGLGESRLEFSEWVKRAYGDRDPRYYDNPLMFMPQLDWISDEDGQVAVDFIGRFERLADDFQEVCRRIGVHATLPHLKSSGDHDYRDAYDEAARAIVADRFARDLEHFGYTFDGAGTGSITP